MYWNLRQHRGFLLAIAQVFVFIFTVTWFMLRQKTVRIVKFYGNTINNNNNSNKINSIQKRPLADFR